MRIMKRNEIDRPTDNSLLYLTKIRPHPIHRDPWIVDPYAKEAIEELTNKDVVEQFGSYTRSFYTLEGHYANLWKYDKVIVPKPQDPLLDEAIVLAREAFRLPQKVQSIGWDSIASVPFIRTTSAGWGYVGKKGDGDNHATAIRRAVRAVYWWHEGRAGTNEPYKYAPDLAYTRTQLGTADSPKIRHVWGEAFENILLEGMTAFPLIKAYQALGDPIPIGIHLYKRLPSIINQTLYSENEQRIAVGIDISGFDSSVQPWLIHEAFNILEENIEFHDFMGPRVFEYVKHHFIVRPVVMPDGRMWLKRMGIPSGSYYTQLVDSVVNLIANYYSQLKVYGRTFKTWVLGDDSLFGVPLDLPYPNLTQLAEHFATLGFTVHPEKAEVGERADEIKFLGHAARGTKVSRDYALTMRLALYPEHPVSGPADSLSRVRGLMLDSGLTSWPIVQLNEYMSAKYSNSTEFKELEYPMEDRSWMRNVIGHDIAPRDISLLHAWTFT